MAIDYENQLNKMKEAQKQSAIADLENTRNQALSDLQAERESSQRNYNASRNQASVQNQIAAKNFKEYLVNSGRANSGIMPQYEMNRQNNLQRSLNDLGSAQNIALADIDRRNTLANQTYNSGLQSANANIEANYINNLLAQQQAAWEREMQEKQFNEQVRQYNENLAFQKQQYADQLARQRVSSGSSGRSSGGSSSNKLTTAYYSGNYNSDVKYGTFSNGYQPDNVNGNKLTATGQKVQVKSKTLQGTTTTTNQNVWKTSDGTKYVWDGTKNKYVQVK